MFWTWLFLIVGSKEMTNTMQQTSPWVSLYLPLASTLIVAIATVVLVWLTSKYVCLTGRLVEESQRSREPSVTVDFELPDHTLQLVVANHGLSPAKDVRISVTKDVSWLHRGTEAIDLSKLGPIKNGISYLTPSRTLKYYVGSPRWKNTPDEQMEASLCVTYEDEKGKKYEHTIDFDFSQMRELLFESFKDSNIAVAEAIREAERDRRTHERTRQMFSTVTAVSSVPVQTRVVAPMPRRIVGAWRAATNEPLPTPSAVRRKRERTRRSRAN
jgi:hypothetical protein